MDKRGRPIPTRIQCIAENVFAEMENGAILNDMVDFLAEQNYVNGLHQNGDFDLCKNIWIQIKLQESV